MEAIENLAIELNLFDRFNGWFEGFLKMSIDFKSIDGWFLVHSRLGIKVNGRYNLLDKTKLLAGHCYICFKQNGLIEWRPTWEQTKAVFQTAQFNFQDTDFHVVSFGEVHLVRLAQGDEPTAHLLIDFPVRVFRPDLGE